MARNFRDLLVWQKALSLTVSVYRASQSWPREEQFGLTAQIRRACVSVTSNIAEGEGRKSSKEFLQFLRIAHASLREVESQLFVARELGYLSEPDHVAIDAACAEVGRMLNGLQSAVAERV